MTCEEYEIFSKGCLNQHYCSRCDYILVCDTITSNNMSMSYEIPYDELDKEYQDFISKIEFKKNPTDNIYLSADGTVYKINVDNQLSMCDNIINSKTYKIIYGETEINLIRKK